MPAELGQTTDPKALIPGDPGAITNDLRDVAANLEKMDGVKDALKDVNPGQWAGDAADAFRSVFGKEPGNWARAVESAGQGAGALSDFGRVLAWGQSEAQRAIDMYTQAQAASRAAAAQYDAQEAAGRTMAPFQDPGQGAAQEAQKILSDARSAVGTVGDAVAKKLGFQKNADGTFTTDLGGIDGSKGKDFDRSFGSQSDGMLGDKVDGILQKLGINTTIASGTTSGSADVDQGETSGSFKDGGVSGTGKADGSVLGADGTASGSVGWLGASGNASGDAYLAKGDASGRVDFGRDADVAGKASGEIGADGSASGTIGVTGAQASAEAFAGAKAAASGSADVGGVTAGVNGEAWAGVGAEASGQFGMGSDGKFHIGASIGAALGIGGKLGFNISVDPKQVENTVSDLAHDAGHIAGEAGDAIGTAASDVGHAAGSVVGDIGSGIKHLFG